MKHLDFILWDLIILQASFILGYMIRHGWGELPYLQPSYRSLAIILTAVDILVAVLFNTMHNVMKRGYLKEFTASIEHVALVLVLMSLYLFSAQAGDTYSRITLYLTSGFHLILGFGIRVLWKPVIRRINRNKPKGAMILVAEENAVPEILKKAGEQEDFRYSGLVLSNRDGTGESIKGIRVVSAVENAADYICREWVDEVFIYPEHLTDLKTISSESVEKILEDPREAREDMETEEPENQSHVARLIEQCREMAIPVHIHLPINAISGKSFMEKVGGNSVLTMTANYANPRQALIKRIIDISGGIVGSISALIVMAVVGPKIKKESPGPILFRQTRIGQNGKKFTFYKIRSMYLDAEQRKKELLSENRNADGMMFKMDFDPRIIGNRISEDGKQITGIGEMIRKTSLDEFPQFFNVLKGEMSLVGTRPPTEDEWEKYKYHHRARLATKPGITGMWQVSGRSRITDFEEVVKLDTEYINNWSLSLDFRILVKTIRTVLKRDGAM